MLRLWQLLISMVTARLWNTKGWTPTYAAHFLGHEMTGVVRCLAEPCVSCTIMACNWYADNFTACTSTIVCVDNLGRVQRPLCCECACWAQRTNCKPLSYVTYTERECVSGWLGIVATCSYVMNMCFPLFVEQF